ncbi:MAG: sulfite exporter TauE/SafE family protein [Nitrososphaerales archaeon]|nr:sulfite exporter TauE/SafE family protein [Nitrososphaerales archaeon]
MLDILTILLMTVPVGVLGALTGLGGGSILVPILVALGVPVKYAIAASMVSIIATSSGAGASSLREGIVNVKAGMYLAIFTVIGAIVGATLSNFVNPRFLYFAFAAFLLTAFLGLRRHLREEVPSGTLQDGLSRRLELEGRYYDKSLKREVGYKMRRPLLAGAGMLVAGLAAGLLGIGGGAFKMSIQENVLRMPTKVSSTTSNFIIGMTALAGASVYFASGQLYLGLAAPMAVGTAVGAVIGGRVLNRLPNRGVKVLFLVIVTYLIIQMLYKGVTS